MKGWSSARRTNEEILPQIRRESKRWTVAGSVGKAAARRHAREAKETMKWKAMDFGQVAWWSTERTPVREPRR